MMPSLHLFPRSAYSIIPERTSQHSYYRVQSRIQHTFSNFGIFRRARSGANEVAAMTFLLTPAHSIGLLHGSSHGLDVVRGTTYSA